MSKFDDIDDLDPKRMVWDKSTPQPRYPHVSESFTANISIMDLGSVIHNPLPEVIDDKFVFGNFMESGADKFTAPEMHTVNNVAGKFGSQVLFDLEERLKSGGLGNEPKSEVVEFVHKAIANRAYAKVLAKGSFGSLYNDISVSDTYPSGREGSDSKFNGDQEQASFKHTGYFLMLDEDGNPVSKDHGKDKFGGW